MKTIYLVRHGENPANLTKEFSCRHVDYSLTPKGIEQARQTARHFMDLATDGHPIDHVFASPLKRAHETAQIIARGLDLDVIDADGLREVNVGEFELHGDLHENWRLHNQIMDDWRSGQPERRFPGGEDLHGLHARVRHGMQQILDTTERASIVVSHGGIVAFGVSAIADPLGVDLGAEHPNCSISRLVFPDGLPGKVEGWAEWGHLTGDAAQIVSGILDPESI